MTQLHLHILSPDGVLVDERVSQANLPGEMGPFEVLAGHAALISPLVGGEVRYVTESGPRTLAIRSGFAEIRNNEILLAVEPA